MGHTSAPRRVLLAGGGTAGHTSPLLATADALRRRDPDIEITALGTARGLETRVIPEAGYPLELIPPVPLPRRLNADLVRTPGRLRGAMKAALDVLDRVQPDVVVGFGGYVSVPAYLAARKRKLPLVVHEGNALPGIANKLGARFTAHVATSFPGTELPHARYIGLPIRRMISTLDRAQLREQARAGFGLDPDRPTLLVTGGSQGARRLNQSVAAAAPAFAAAGVQVLHILGPTGEANPEVTIGGPAYVTVPFVSRMDLAYAAADAVLCRAGSNTVTEVSGVGLPAIYVPLPIGNGEQALNARPVVDAGGGTAGRRRRADRRVGRGDRARPAHRRAPARRDVRGRRRPDPARRRRQARRDDPGRRLAHRSGAEGGPMRVPVPDVLLPADQLGTVHFIGIGGAGLSGIARIMLARGMRVSGSDAKESRTLDALRALGATCHVGHAAAHLGDADSVVISTAVREDNPEVVEAVRRGLRLLPRSAALESVMQGRTVVAVAGTHGKTTTTSLLTVALQHCGADPSFAIGGELNETGSNAHDGSGDLFVAEADESDGAFLVYSPYAALVTNVEADHLDN